MKHSIQMKIGKRVISNISSTGWYTDDDGTIRIKDMTMQAESWLKDCSPLMFKECRKNSHSRVFSYRHGFIG